MWGEPFRNCGLVQALSESLTTLSDTHPRDREDIPENEGSALVSSFIATLSPRVADLLDAHTSFFRRLYEQPALDKGFQRWGVKEVRLTAEHAVYLQWLFPRAKFVFLYRNPFDAYRSYRTFPTFYVRWPDEPVLSARHFGHVWRERLTSFLPQPVNSVIVRFEDLVSKPVQVTESLSEFLESELDPRTMDLQISGRGERGRSVEKPNPVPWAERRALRRAIGPLLEEVGYYSS